MNELQIFKSSQFGEIRTLEENGKPLFCGSDIAKALGYTNAPDALARHCRAIVKRDTPISGKFQSINFIPEGDVYRLITHSKLPAAQQFETWVFDEVLPTLRRTGTYSTTPEKKALAEAKLRNARAREATAWLKIAGLVPLPTYKQVCASYASAALANGKEVIPLPAAGEALYTATQIGEMFGVSGNRIGTLANANGLKSEEYGQLVWDKSPYGPKQVQVFRYNQKAIRRFSDLLNRPEART